MAEMTKRFTDHLRELAAPIWQAQHKHPFVRGIGDGSLDPERFKFWVRQDYIFLVDYARLFSLAAARAPDAATTERLAALAHSTLTVEMDLHRSYAARFGISRKELEQEEKSPTTQGYGDFLLRTATLGDYAELVAAVLPCMWSFSEIGLRLAEGGRPADERYAEWIDIYSAPAFAELATWCREIVDTAAQGLPPSALKRMETAFITSSRYELMFWESAWQQQTWPA